MGFNPDPKKRTIEVCFSQKIISNNPRPISFNQSPVKISGSHKPVGLILDTKLKFNEHLQNKTNKCNRINGSIKKSLILPRTCLLTIYEAFVRPHLDNSFKDWLEKVQCNATLAIAGAIRCTSRERI